MKKILSLILVVVMLALTLTSCAYSYANDDMKNYATVKIDEFKAALKTLVIEDGDFTTDEAVRAQKVLETIRNTIGKEADLTAKETEGVVGTYDILYYAFYATANFGEGEEAVRLSGSTMKESAAVKLQLGMVSTADELETAIMEALKDNDIKDHIYATKTTGEVKTGDTVYVSYSYETIGSDNKPVTVKVQYRELVLGDDELSQKITSEACKTIGTKAQFTLGADAYKDVVVEWAIDAEKCGEKLGSFEVTDYDKDGKLKDESGEERKFSDIKDGKITYHIYPVYYVKTADFTAELILDTLLGASASADVLEVFGDESYKIQRDNKDVSLATLIGELAASCTTRDNAEKTLTSAKTTLATKEEAVLKAEGTEAGPTDAQKQAVTDAKKAVDEAKVKYDEAVAAVKAKVDTILGISEDLGDKIVADYEELAYKSLKSQYDNEIYEKVAKEVWGLIKNSELVKVNSCPVKAVDEAAARILENHEYIFYTGTKDSTTKESYYKAYNGDFKAYLIKTFADGKTYEDAIAAIREDATEAVTDIVRVYAVSEMFECVLSDSEYSELIKSDSYYQYNSETYGETNVRTAYQFDKLMTTILEVETYEEDEGENKKGELKPYVDGKLPFKDGKVSYTFKTEEDESDAKE